MLIRSDGNTMVCDTVKCGGKPKRKMIHGNDKNLLDRYERASFQPYIDFHKIVNCLLLPHETIVKISLFFYPPSN